MTLTEFMKKFNLKNEKTVKKWLEEGLMMGGEKDEQSGKWSLSDLARPPYTKARARNTSAIYSSSVRACIQRKSVCAKLYKISEEEFDEYINNLTKVGLISKKIVDGQSYFFATPVSETYIEDERRLKKHIKMAVKTVRETAVMFKCVGV